jgi:hypothetical protein
VVVPVVVRRYLMKGVEKFETHSYKAFYLSGWRDLNSRPLDPQTSAARPRTSSYIQFSLKLSIFDLRGFRWTNTNGGQNGGQTHSQTKLTLAANAAAFPDI